MRLKPGSRLELFQLFLAEQRDPVPFHQRLSREAVADIPAELDGAVVVDLGCGPGH